MSTSDNGRCRGCRRLVIAVAVVASGAGAGAGRRAVVVVVIIARGTLPKLQQKLADKGGRDVDGALVVISDHVGWLSSSRVFDAGAGGRP